MTELEKPVLSLLDAFPGAGKTHLFRELAQDLLLFDDPESNGDFVFVYVAPTLILCEEVYNSLCAQIEAIWKDNAFAREPAVFDRIYRVWIGAPGIDSASSSLNRLLGTSSSKKGEAAERRSVIITTHEAFVRVRNSPTKVPTWVFFDEARQCLGVKKSIRLPMNVAPKILKHFKPVEVQARGFQMEETELEKTNRKVYRLSPPDTDEIPTPKGASASVHRAIASLQDLTEGIQSGRSSVYILAPESAVDRTGTTSVSRSISIFPFQNPQGLFQNYARVTILSAFFKSSQMYHALRSHYRIVDLLRPKESASYPRWIRNCISLVNRSTSSPKFRDRVLRLNTGVRLKVVPLMVSKLDVEPSSSQDDLTPTVLNIDLEKVSKADRLSKNVLSSGLIVTTEVQSQVIDYINDNDLPMNGNSVIHTVWLHWYYLQSSQDVKNSIVAYWEDEYGASYKRHVPSLYSLLEPFIVDQRTSLPVFPAWTLTRQALALSKAIKCDEKPLLVYNAKKSKIPYTPIPRKILKKAGLPLNSMPVEDTQAFLRERFSKSFNIPDSPRLNGLNTWVNSRHFVHLAALNPPPDVVLLLNHILPRYDVAYDYMLENLVQTLYRTSLRNPLGSDKKPVYLYISKSSIARLLSQKLQLQFNFLDMSEIDRYKLVDLSFTTDSFKERRSKRISATMQKYSSKEVYAAVNRARAKLRRYLLIEKSGVPLTTKQQAAMNAAKSELKRLQNEGV